MWLRPRQPFERPTHNGEISGTMRRLRGRRHSRGDQRNGQPWRRGAASGLAGTTAPPGAMYVVVRHDTGVVYSHQ